MKTNLMKCITTVAAACVVTLALTAGAATAQVIAQLIDNKDGTITDTARNLVWLKNANCFGERAWSDAMNAAAGLSPGQCGLSNNPAGQGQWRLPTAAELQIRAQNKDGFTNVQASAYWSSSSGDGYFIAYADHVYMPTGYIHSNLKNVTCYVWPVRGR